MIDSFQVINT